MDRHFKRLRPLPGEDGSGCHIIGELLTGGQALGSIIGGMAGGSAAEDAAEAQQAALQQGYSKAKKQYRAQREAIAPYMTAGGEALQAIRSGLGVGGDPEAAGYGELVAPFTEDDFRADPGYGFRLAEGEKAINRAAAARGQFMNPATAKELLRYGGGLADQTYGDAFNRYQLEQGNRFNRLASLMGVGQSAVDQMGQARTAQANAALGLGSQMGDAAASGILNAANARISGLTGGLSGAIDQYNINRMINQYGGAAAANSVRYPGTTYPSGGYGG